MVDKVIKIDGAKEERNDDDDGGSKLIIIRTPLNG